MRPENEVMCMGIKHTTKWERLETGYAGVVNNSSCQKDGYILPCFLTDLTRQKAQYTLSTFVLHV